MRTLAWSCVVVLLSVGVAAGQSATGAQRPTAGGGEAAAQRGSGEAAWQPGALDRSALPTSRAFDYEFDDVQISTIAGWLRRVGVEAPVQLDGRVTGWVWAQAPARGWWRLSDYRVEGELTSPLLDIDRYSIRRARLRFGYYQGNWTVGRAVGQIESIDPETDERRVLGQANLAGHLPMSRTAPMRIEGTLREVSLSELLLTLGLRAIVPRGNAEGNFVIDTTINQLSQPLSWNARGAISAGDVRIGDLPALALQTDWQLAGAELGLTHARATLAGQTIELAANLKLTGPFAWNVQLPNQPVVLAPEIYQAFQVAVTPALPLGTVQLAASSSGQLAPWRAQYAAQLGAQQLTWYGNNLGNVSTALALTAAGIRIDSLNAQVAGGTIMGQAQWPTAPTQPVSATFDFAQVDLAQLRLPADLPAMMGVVSGTARASVDPAAVTDLRPASVDLRGNGTGVQIGQWGLGQVEYAASKQAGADALAVRVDARGAGGNLTAEAQWPVAEEGDVSASLEFEQVDLAQLNVPAQLRPLSGFVSGAAQAKLDRSKLDDLQGATVSARGTGTNVRIGDFDLGQISYAANKAAAADMLGLSLGAQLGGGSVTSDIQWPTGEAKAVVASLNYQSVNLAQLRLPADLPPTVGIVSGTAQATLDASKLTDLRAAAWATRGDGTGVRVGEWGFGRIAYDVSKKADADDIALSLADAAVKPRWTGQGKVTPVENGNWTYDIRATADRLDLSFAQLLGLLAPETHVPVPIALVYTTGNLAFRGNSAQGLTATEFDLSQLDAVQSSGARWASGSLAGRTSPTLIEIDRSAFQVGAGTVKFATTWHRAAGAGGPQGDGEPLDRVQLDMKNFSIEALRGWGVSVLPVEVAGQADIDLNVQRPAGRPSWLVGWVGALAMTIENLAVRGQPVGTLSASGDLDADRWQTRVTGQAFEAPLHGSVDVLIAHRPDWRVSGMRGTLSWLGGAAERVIALWQGPQQANHWRGTANIRAEIDWQFEGPRSGFVLVDVPRLVYRGRSVARDFTLNARLDNDRVRLVRLDGGIAGGRVDATGDYDVVSERTTGVVANFQRVSLQEVMQLYDPDIAANVKGRADLRVRLMLSRGVDMHGVLNLNDSEWYGVPVSEAHSDFELNASPDYSIVRVHAANIRGRGFGGRLDGDLTAHLGTRRSFESRVRIRRGEVEQLSKWLGTTSVVGKGKFDAELDLGAARLVTSRDLQGRLDLRFEDTDAQTLPIADQLTRFVPLFGIPSTEFERGRLVGTISRGALRMRSVALWGPQLSVLGSGNVGLGTGRLDLQLVIRVGGGLTEQLAANYLAQLAATSVPPVELVLQINRLVANRAIYLRVAGTASKPVVQPQAARMLEQALLRSLLEQVAPIAAAATSPMARVP